MQAKIKTRKAKIKLKSNKNDLIQRKQISININAF